MKDRLAEFLQQENLTAVKFAEIMEVQPSSISHLLSGRNKPNFDFISRILLRFPNLNPDWFINGNGGIYKSNPQAQDVDITNVIQSNIPVMRSVSEENRGNLQENSLFESMQSIDSNDKTEEITSVNIQRQKESITEGRKAPAEPDNMIPERHPKTISRIVIFYSDGSFDEYHN